MMQWLMQAVLILTLIIHKKTISNQSINRGIMSMYIDKVHLYCDQCENDTMIESEELGSIDIGKKINHEQYNSLSGVVSDFAFNKGWYIDPINNLVSCPSCDDGKSSLDYHVGYNAI